MIADIGSRRRDYDEAALFDARGRYGASDVVSIGTLALGARSSAGAWSSTASRDEASWNNWQGYLLGPLGLGGRDGDWAFANLGVLAALVIGFVRDPGRPTLHHRPAGGRPLVTRPGRARRMSTVAFVGGNGQIARRCTRCLVAARSHADRFWCRRRKPSATAPEALGARGAARSTSSGTTRSSTPPSGSTPRSRGGGPTGHRAQAHGRPRGRAEVDRGRPAGRDQPLRPGLGDQRRRAACPTMPAPSGVLRRSEARRRHRPARQRARLDDHPPRHAHRRRRRPASSSSDQDSPGAEVPRADVAAVLAEVARLGRRHRRPVEPRVRRSGSPVGVTLSAGTTRR